MAETTPTGGQDTSGQDAPGHDAERHDAEGQDTGDKAPAPTFEAQGMRRASWSRPPSSGQKPAASEGPNDGHDATKDARQPTEDMSTSSSDEPDEGKPREEEKAQLYEVKVGGRTVNVTLDQLKTMAQKAEASDQRFRTAAEAVKKADALLEELDKDPASVLIKLKGPEAFERLMADHLRTAAERAQLTPEQKLQAERDRELEDLRQKLSEREKVEENRRQEEATKAASERLEAQLVSAAERHGLAKDPKALEALAEVALELIDMGLSPTPDQLALEAKERYRSGLSKYREHALAGLEGERLLAELGEEVVDRVLKATLTRKKEQPRPPPVATRPEPEERPFVSRRGPMDASRFRR